MEKFRGLFGEKVSPLDIILYELDVESDSKPEMIFMMNEKSCPTAPLTSEFDNIILGNMVSKKVVFILKDIEKMKKQQ